MKEKTESTKQENPILEMTEQALKTCEQAIQNGLKLQEEAARRWTDMLTQTTPFTQDWQKRFNGLSAAAKELAPATQKRMEEMLELVNKNSRTSAEIFKKATEGAQAATFADRQAAWKDLWSTSLGAVRSNAETLTEINNRMVDTWVEFVQKSTEAAQSRSAQAA